MPRDQQGPLDLLILKTLARGPQHGFGVLQHIEDVSGGSLRIEEGSLYPALHRLERDRFVTARWRQSDAGRRARYYALTAAGERRLAEVESSWKTVSEGVAKVLRFAQ